MLPTVSFKLCPSTPLRHGSSSLLPVGDREKLTTPDGTPLNLAVSALIKSLRRGRELQALDWALRIERKFPKYLWRKLATFAAEDVSIGNPHAVVVIDACAQVSERHRTEGGSRRSDSQAIALAVMYLARSPKSRESDALLAALSHIREDGWAAPVPPEAFDLHTEEGRERPNRLRHWLDEASRIEPEVGPLDWKLWIRQWAARRGRLDRDAVDAQARAWNEAGRLRYGIDGYGSVPEAPDGEDG